MMPIIQLGPIALPLSPLTILMGIWIGVVVSERYARRNGMNPNTLSNLILIAMVSGVLGGRLVYIARNASAFSGNIVDIFSRNISLVDPLGGFVIGIIAGAIYGQRKSLPFWATLDAITPGLTVVNLAVAFSHFFSGAAFGLPTDLPWGIELWGVTRHPTQIYEIATAALILIALWFGEDYLQSRKPGILFLTFLAVTSASKLFLEAFRADSVLISFGVRRDQILYWVILAVSLVGIHKIQTSDISSTIFNTQHD